MMHVFFTEDLTLQLKCMIQICSPKKFVVIAMTHIIVVDKDPIIHGPSKLWEFGCGIALLSELILI